MDILTESKEFDYLEARRRQQLSLESYINECVILSEGDNVFKNLQAFNEEEKKTGWEAIKEGFKKFGNFIKRIFMKFFDNMSRLVQGNKNWLNKHKATILNNPFKFDSVTMPNYPVGIQRMVDSSVPAFTNYDEIKDKLDTEQNAFNWMAKSVGYGKFQYSSEINFNLTMQNWFQGGEVDKTFTAKALNMSDIFNYCYEYEDNIGAKIRKDQTILDNAIKVLTDAIDAREKDSAVVDDTQDKKEEQKAQDAAENKKVEDTTKKYTNSSITAKGDVNDINSQNDDPETGSKIGPESVVFSNVLGTYINEVEFGSKSDSNTNTSTVAYKASQSSGVVGNEKNTAASNMKNVKYGSDDNKETVDNANSKRIEDETSKRALEEMRTAIINYQNAARGVLGGKLNAAQKCYKDYMQILVKHVKSYMANDQYNNKTTQAATNYNNGTTSSDSTQASAQSAAQNNDNTQQGAAQNNTQGEQQNNSK